MQESKPDETTQQRPGADARWSARNPAAAALVYTIIYLTVSLAGALLSAVRLPLVVAIAVPLLAWPAILLCSLLLALSISRLRLSAWVELAWVVAMVALFALARPDVFAIAGRLLGHAATGKEIASLLNISPGQQLIGNAALIVWAVFLGRLVSRVIREGKLLLPVAAVASVADTITVFWGVVHHMSQKAPEVVETFSAQTPVSGPPSMPLPILSFVGIGDFLFLAVFLTVLVRYAMDPVRAAWASFALMLIAPMPFMIWPGLQGMPGLPFISVAVLSTNWRYLRFSREEVRALAFVGILVLAAAAWVISRR